MRVRFSPVLFACAVLMSVVATRAAEEAPDTDVDPNVIAQCDPAVKLSGEERAFLFSKLRISSAGRQILADFKAKHGQLPNLAIQWDSVSYSQMVKKGICVHLAHKLPDIEHVADLAHELTHATRLELPVLRGEVDNADEFVRLRLAARGGEADAFGVECTVKHEILGEWDGLCGPYAKTGAMDVKRVLDDLYSGELSASLTGEPYPVMLARQFRAILAKRAGRQPAAVKYSALENKPATK